MAKTHFVVHNIKKEYNQQPQESYDDWKYRLLLGKKRGSVDLTWQELCNLLGISLSPEYVRKVISGIYAYDKYLKDTHQQQDEEKIPQETIDKLQAKEFELRRQKQQMQDQKRELNKQLREWARADHIKSEILREIKKLPSLQHPSIQGKKNKKISSGVEAALLLSDWHIGMTTANAVNTFNHTVFQSRVENLLAQTLTNCKRHNVSKLHIFALGDLVNGLIHITTRINNEEDIVRQCMRAAETLCYLLSAFSEHMNIELYWSRGNHDRVSANKKESVCRESFADLILWYLEARMEGIENIHINKNDLDDEIIIAEILGNKIFAVHGHKDKPTKAVQNLSLLLKQFPDYVFMGHFHSAAEREVQGAEIIVNGSLCGTDDYAMSLRRTSHPSQKLLIFDENGRVCTYNERLDV